VSGCFSQRRAALEWVWPLWPPCSWRCVRHRSLRAAPIDRHLVSRRRARQRDDCRHRFWHGRDAERHGVRIVRPALHHAERYRRRVSRHGTGMPVRVGYRRRLERRRQRRCRRPRALARRMGCVIACRTSRGCGPLIAFVDRRCTARSPVTATSSPSMSATSVARLGGSAGDTTAIMGARNQCADITDCPAGIDRNAAIDGAGLAQPLSSWT